MSNIIETCKDIMASIIGSTACVYTGQPFDTIKVRIQVQPGEFKSSLDCLIKTFRADGVFAFWRGSIPALTGSLAENAVAFAVNGELQRYFTKSQIFEENKNLKSIQPYVSGGITGVFSSLVLCPCDIVKCRAQISQSNGVNNSISEIVKVVLRTQSVRGLFTGLGAQMFRDVPFYATFFGFYEFSCEYFKKHTNFSDPTIYFMSGGFAGQVAWIASIAQDTIKSKIQTSDVPLSIRKTFRIIVREQGIKGLFSGIDATLIRAFPANAALFVGYEISRKMMK